MSNHVLAVIKNIQTIRRQYSYVFGKYIIYVYSPRNRNTKTMVKKHYTEK